MPSTNLRNTEAELTIKYYVITSAEFLLMSNYPLVLSLILVNVVMHSFLWEMSFPLETLQT
jgi:hypothetical protein